MKHYVTTDPEIMGGQPCIAGTRIPVSLLLIRLKQGYSLKAIQEHYPHVPLTIFEAVLEELAERVGATEYDPKVLQT